MRIMRKTVHFPAGFSFRWACTVGANENDDDEFVVLHSFFFSNDFRTLNTKQGREMK